VTVRVCRQFAAKKTPAELDRKARLHHRNELDLWLRAVQFNGNFQPRFDAIVFSETGGEFAVFH
jgi:hypothetical protein